jgi:hypothetical protein
MANIKQKLSLPRHPSDVSFAILPTTTTTPVPNRASGYVLKDGKLKNGTVIPYGCGWGLSPWQGRRRVFHDGGLPGLSTDFERFIDDRLTVVVLSNTQRADASRIALAVAGFYLPPAASANATHP